jgi:NADH:ubiquinone oxidoreductase subunit B-like Fe-S oxidoreductase
MILKARLCTDSELGYIAQLLQENLLTAGVTTHTRLTRLSDFSLWLEEYRCACCGAEMEVFSFPRYRFEHNPDCPVVLARLALRPSRKEQ